MWLLSRMVRYADRIAVSSRSKEYSYRQLLSEAELLSKTFSGHDRICCWAEPGFDYSVIQSAVWRAGAVFVPLCHSHPIEELQYYLEDSKASMLVAAGNQHEHMAKLAEKCRIQFVGVNVEEGNRIREDGIEDFKGKQMDDPAMIIYTSGTTGKVRSLKLDDFAHISLAERSGDFTCSA
jgi:malonyl-CoA/methylmalonyl-CoA synthetase